MNWPIIEPIDHRPTNLFLWCLPLAVFLWTSKWLPRSARAKLNKTETHLLYKQVHYWALLETFAAYFSMLSALHIQIFTWEEQVKLRDIQILLGYHPKWLLCQSFRFCKSVVCDLFERGQDISLHFIDSVTVCDATKIPIVTGLDVAWSRIFSTFKVIALSIFAVIWREIIVWVTGYWYEPKAVFLLY